jgi:glutamate--cysteine ligase
VHLSLDYCDLDDWARKVRIIILLTPVAVALFANSPAAVSGRHYRAYRPVAWHNADPVRTRVPETALHPRFRVGDWISWLLDVPPLFAASDGGLVPAPHPRLEDVNHGGPVEWADLRLHLSGVFAPVRSYQYLEIRSADVPPAHLLPAVPAFWCGLLYCLDALEAALRLVEPYSSSQEWLGLFDEATQHGLVAGSELEKLARQALELASYGLRHKCACVSRPDLATGHLMRLATERLPAPHDCQTL